MGRWRLNPPAHDFIETGSPVTSFVCASACLSADRCPAPPVARTRRFDCLAEATPPCWLCAAGTGVQALPGPNRGTLIRVRLFKHRLTTGTGYHSGRHTPCTVSTTLRNNSHVGRTHLSEPARHVRGSRLVMVSSPGGLISGGRIQKHPPTRPGQVFPDSAPSLLPLTGKGLMPLSSLSFSRSAFCAEPRKVSASGSSVSPPGSSRRQHTLPEPVEPCTRSALMALVPESRGGIGKSLVFRTRFESHDSAGLHGRAFPARPHSRTARRHEIESGDYSRQGAGDYFQKPLSNVAGHSRGTTLYGTRT